MQNAQYELKEDQSLDDLAFTLGISKRTLIRRRKEAGIRSKAERLTPDQKTKIFDMHTSGVKVTEIAKDLGVERLRVYDYLKTAHGIVFSDSSHLKDIEELDITEFKVMLESGKSLSDVSEITGYTYGQLWFKSTKLGIDFKNKYQVVSDVELPQLIDLYNYGFSSVELSEFYNCDKSSLLRILNLEGVEVKTHKELKFYRGYTINEDAFSDLETEESAHFYGWLLTDGWVTKANIGIELSSKDEELLVNLKDYLQSSNSIHRRSRVVKKTGNISNMASFKFSHEVIFDRLKALGLSENKSLKEICPDNFKLNRHFWRGVVEGDGHIAKSSYSVEVCGGEQLTKDFAAFCKSIDPEANVYMSRNGKMFVAKVGKKSTTKLVLDELYRDCSLKLSRKYNVYLERYVNADTN